MTCYYREDEVALSSIFYLFAMSPQTFKVLSVLSGGSGLQGLKHVIALSDVKKDHIDLSVWFSAVRTPPSAIQAIKHTFLGAQGSRLAAPLHLRFKQLNTPFLVLKEVVHILSCAFAHEAPGDSLTFDISDPLRSHVINCQHWTRAATQAIKHTFLGAQGLAVKLSSLYLASSAVFRTNSAFSPWLCCHFCNVTGSSPRSQLCICT